ncbi:hypothetical protein K438DRAFT_1773234 [Mycena galopus ATCC 62051]|nr:hypothetical protein K438DRAFT_1773234 [Mycena galopus ATCC 62051]
MQSNLWRKNTKEDCTIRDHLEVVDLTSRLLEAKLSASKVQTRMLDTLCVTIYKEIEQYLQYSWDIMQDIMKGAKEMEEIRTKTLPIKRSTTKVKGQKEHRPVSSIIYSGNTDCETSETYWRGLLNCYSQLGVSTRLLDVPYYVKPSRDMPIVPESMQPLYQTTRSCKTRNAQSKLGYGCAGIIGPGKKQQRNAKAKGTRKAKHIHSQEDASLLDECAVTAGKIVLQSAWLDDLSFSTIFDIQHNLKTGSEILAMTDGLEFEVEFDLWAQENVGVRSSHIIEAERQYQFSAGIEESREIIGGATTFSFALHPRDVVVKNQQLLNASYKSI